MERLLQNAAYSLLFDCGPYLDDDVEKCYSSLVVPLRAVFYFLWSFMIVPSFHSVGTDSVRVEVPVR